MIISGSCHCGNITFSLDWPGQSPEIPARACSCSFCLRHGGLWTSNPAATLTVNVASAARVSKYSFGTETAIFHVCSRCGVVPIVTCELDQQVYAVVNVNAFQNVDPARLRRSTADFEAEDVESRLARRKRNWIPNVRLVAASHSGEGSRMPDADEPFHAHIYYGVADRAAAGRLHAGLRTGKGSGELADVVFVGEMTDRPVGPHPVPQYEVHFYRRALPAVLERIRASHLRALVHRLTDDDLADHTSEALWIGEPLALDLSVLDPPGMNQGIARFGKSDF